MVALMVALAQKVSVADPARVMSGVKAKSIEIPMVPLPAVLMVKVLDARKARPGVPRVVVVSPAVAVAMPALKLETTRCLEYPRNTVPEQGSP